MEPARKTRLKKAVFGCLAVLLGTAVLVGWIRPGCPILHVTGLYCPGCGGQRMLLALLRGDLAAAFGYNPFLLVLSPFLALYLAVELVRYVRGKPLLLYTAPMRGCLAALALLAVAFMVLRNLPGWAFLRP